MNWTGGKLQRNAKGKGNAVVERQKSHFAKARNKAPNRTGSSTKAWDQTSPTRPPSPPPFKKARTQRKHSPRIQQWSISGQKDEHRIVGDFVLPSRNSDVHVRVGKRAFASQLDTTVASPSTRIRSQSIPHSDYSSNSMLLDDFDQQGSQSEASDSGEIHRSDQGNGLAISCVPERTRFTLSDSLEDILQSQDDTQLPSDFATRATSVVHAAASPRSTSNNTSAEDMQSSPNAAERLEGSPVRPQHEHPNISGTHALDCATSDSHEDPEDNDDTWLRFIAEEKVEVGHARSDRCAAPQSKMQASPNALPTLTVVQDEPLYTASVRSSTPHSSCPTARACLLETGTFKRIGGETSEKGPRLSSDDQVWRRFVLGYDPTKAS
jgi:hypothetical protein